jgi:hypothetical protein
MVRARWSLTVPLPSPEKCRFPFITQRPTEDGCGAYVLQMLTGTPLGELEKRIGWTPGALRRSVWSDLLRVLGDLNWSFGTPQPAAGWDDVRGIAIVHVKDDHFMLYDADNSVFYDPWEWEGPALECNRVPLSYLTVHPPSAGQAA